LSCDVTTDIDWCDFEEKCKSARYEARSGEIWYSWLIGGLAANIAKHAADPLLKSAIAKAWTTGVITHRFDDNW
jgi:hypothetical protein